MPDNANDIISQIEGSSARQSNNYDAAMYDKLSEISKNLDKLASNTLNIANGSARAKMDDQVARGQKLISEQKVGRREKKKEEESKVRGGWDGFFDGIEDGIFGDFKKSMKSSLSDFADGISKELGVTKEAIPNEIGKKLSQSAMNSIKDTAIGDAFNMFSSSVSTFTDVGMSALSNGVKAISSGGATLGTGVSAVTSTITASAGTLQAAAITAAGSMASIAIVAAPLVVAGAALYLGFKQIMKAGDALKEGFDEISQGVSEASNRSTTSQRKAVELAEARLSADVQTLITEPFNNLKNATDDLCSAWESNIQTLNATQGYTKSTLQDLISKYAERLRNEGLSSVVSSASITSNLEQVIKSGLSGAAAEEFAYIATVLGEAVPNQDFFGYASTYAAIAANATKEGMSQQQALAKANAEMEQFASNVLYASRQLSGGFSTGLQNTSELFSDAFKIAQSAKTDNVADVSGVLTSVAGIVGAIAPDLSSSLVQSVVDAAIGGNSETNVALRSLAGVNASNTQFLQALANDPKKIFSTLFSNLADMQNSSKDNFMEAAEGLSSVFGVSMDSLARVDFNYLAKAISEMNLNNSSLEDNLTLLADGQTKTTTEQLKIAEINKLMIDEGLSYVLDNEASRAIQQHMWDEQLAREMQEATYAVDLQGSALSFLEKLNEAVKAISVIFHPISSAINKIQNLVATSAQAAAENSDIKKVLELGNVGRTNYNELKKLTTRGKELNLTDSLVSQMGGFSSYEAINSVLQFKNSLNRSGTMRGKVTAIAGMVIDGVTKKISNASSSISNSIARANIQSTYQWGIVSKSLNNAIRESANKNKQYYTEAVNTSLAARVDQRAETNFQNFLDTMKQFVDQGKSYSEWKATASRYGIQNVSESAEDFGLSEALLEGKFKEYEAGQEAEKQYQRQTTEDTFWAQSIDYMKNTAPTFHDKLLASIAKFYKKYESFYNDWINYYVKHTSYTASTLDAYKVEQILNADKTATGDAVNALADALLSNAVDLKDPAVQTNVLLSQMLVTLNAILQQETKTNNSVLPTSISALGLGLVSNT